MKLLLTIGAALIASTCHAQQFQFLTMSQSINAGDVNVPTPTAWNAFFTSIGHPSSGATATFFLTQPAMVQVDAAIVGSGCEFDIINITRPPQQIVLDVTSDSSHELLSFPQGGLYELQADAATAGSTLQFSMVIVPEPSGFWLAMIGRAWVGGIRGRRVF